MNKFILGPALIVIPLTLAHATGGLLCKTVGAHPVEAALVIGHTAIQSIVSARLSDNGRDVPVIVGQSWLEPNEIRLDLVDSNAARHELRLRATWKGQSYDGSIWRNGKRRWIRCRES